MISNVDNWRFVIRGVPCFAFEFCSRHCNSLFLDWASPFWKEILFHEFDIIMLLVFIWDENKYEININYFITLLFNKWFDNVRQFSYRYKNVFPLSKDTDLTTFIVFDLLNHYWFQQHRCIIESWLIQTC